MGQYILRSARDIWLGVTKGDEEEPLRRFQSTQRYRPAVSYIREKPPRFQNNLETLEELDFDVHQLQPLPRPRVGGAGLVRLGFKYLLYWVCG